MSKRFLDGDLCKKISFISIFIIFFLGFKHDFIRCDDYTRIAASNTQVMTSLISYHI